MKFTLFLLVNAALFIRPSEVVPGLEAVPVYNILIVACLVASVGPLFGLLSVRSLAQSPLIVCVLGVMAGVVVSNLGHLDVWTARTAGLEFVKVFLYFMLMIATLDTPERVRKFLTMLAVFTAVLAGVAVLHYFEVIRVPSLQLVERTDEVDPDTGEQIGVVQLIATGLYSDPNDLCSILVVATLIALFRLLDRRSSMLRVVWAAPIALYLLALILTRSRGGFLALLLGLMVLFVGRFGWRKAIPLALLVLPPVLLLAGGRQTRISTEEGTAQGRIQLWSEGFQLLARNPAVGIGAGKFADEVGLVVHNSFVHANAELGFPGGACFVGLFYLPIYSLYRLGSGGVQILDEEMRRLRPYLMAMVVGFATGLMSISRCYVVPTYMLPGLAAAYLRVTRTLPEGVPPRFSPALVRRLALANLAALAVLFVFIRLTLHYD